MAAPQARSVAEQLRDAGDQLYRLADLAETPQRDHSASDRLRDEIETVAGDVRAVVRGRGFR
ncbi:hypothetical protein U1737_13630 [Sphingomonas sp. LB3N6]|uniref:hypothetical protein n=1 Tax=Sphingomonas fucosidasi TaxID=3096164 RepID=UPI002FC74750